MGIFPDIIVARVDAPMPDSIREKIAMFCNVRPECCIENLTVPVLYEAPMMLEKSNLSTIVCNILHLDPRTIDMTEWQEMLDRIHSREKVVKIALCGKYVQLHDAYLSVAEALAHGGYETGAKVEIDWVDTEALTEQNVGEVLKDADGVLIPGGFGGRGIEGKIIACRYAREHNIPYLGICLGMQVAVIEFARNVLGLKDANSSEFYPEGKHSVIDLMPDQYGVKMGGTMRLGAYPCKVIGDRMKEAYKTDLIHERHRHRFEFNNDYREMFEANGMKIAGTSPTARFARRWRSRQTISLSASSSTPSSSRAPITRTRSSVNLSATPARMRRRKATEMKINENYLNLKDSYLFATVGRKTAAYKAAHPEKDVIRLSIGDVTRPLAPAVIEAMHKAVDDMSRAETFHGYGPDQYCYGYDVLIDSIKGSYARKGVTLSSSEVFISDGAKSGLRQYPRYLL